MHLRHENLKHALVPGVSDVASQYDAFLIDLWGVVHDGFNAYAGAVECINQILKDNKKIIFLSNAPIPGRFAKKKLLDFGIGPEGFQVLSSGDVIRHQLLHFEDQVFKNLGKRFYHLIPERNSDILTDIPAKTANTLEEADFILITAYAEEGESLSQYDALFEKAISLNLPAICANPDKVVISGSKNRYCAGIFSERYEKLGGIVHYYGKPHLSIYDQAFKLLSEGGFTDKRKILMIGDTPDTDILGAQNAGIDSLLVLSGNMHNIMKKEEGNKDFSEKLLSALAKYNVNPRWISNSLRW